MITKFRTIQIFVALFLLGAFVLPDLASASHRSGSLSRKIRNLDNDIVEELPVPILLGVTPLNLARNFGDPRSGGRTHEGLDIFAPLGAPIATPTEAVVIRMGEGDSSGLYVYTANPGGETFAYMHLSRFADIDEGDELEVGDLIGYVGDTGNAKGVVPHLHFEILDDDRDPTDPYPRLVKIFPMQERIDSLAIALDDAKDKDEFAEFIVALYKADLLLAKSVGIILPEKIEEKLSVQVSQVIVPTLSNSPILRLGSRGPFVSALQSFLISRNIGAGGALATDGNFGPLTDRALREYQAANGLLPADGIFGPKTKAFMLSH